MTAGTRPIDAYVFTLMIILLADVTTVDSTTAFYSTLESRIYHLDGRSLMDSTSAILCMNVDLNNQQFSLSCSLISCQRSYPIKTP